MKANEQTPYNFIPKLEAYGDIYDKSLMKKSQVLYMLSRTTQMFRYKNLPETIPAHILEKYLQTNGNVCITKVNGKLYTFFGGLGGIPDEYYRPTIYTVANPFLKFSKNLEIGTECVVIKSDSMWQGTLPLISRYVSQMIECDITGDVLSILSRNPYTLSADSDAVYESCVKFLKDVEAGSFGVIKDTRGFQGDNSYKLENIVSNISNTQTQNIERLQYLKASMYNELGLNANYNMKREALNSGETSLNDDILFPFIDDMLYCRKMGIEKVNELFDTNIQVDFNSSWLTNIEEQEIELENLDDIEKSEEASIDDINEETSEDGR